MHMKRICLAVFFAACSFIAVAQNPQEKEVAAAVELLRQAMISGERNALTEIAADQLSYGHSNGLVEDKKAFVEKIVSGQSDFVTIDLSGQTISFSGDVAIVRHLLAADINDNNVPSKIKLNILLIFQKQQGKWKLLARQAARAV